MNDQEFRRRAHALLDSMRVGEGARLLGPEGAALLAAGPEAPPVTFAPLARDPAAAEPATFVPHVRESVALPFPPKAP